MNESRETGFASLNEGKRDYSGRGLRLFKEHRTAIHEIPNGGLNGAATEIGFRREMFRFDLQVAAEKRELVAFGLKVEKGGIGEHEIEHGDAGLDVFEFMPSAVAKVLAAELAIELSG